MELLCSRSESALQFHNCSRILFLKRFSKNKTALSMFLQLQFQLFPQEIISRWGGEGGLFQNSDCLPGEKLSFIHRTAKKDSEYRLRSKGYLNFIRNVSSFDLWDFLFTSYLHFCLKFSIHIVDWCLNYPESILYIIITQAILLIWYQKSFSDTVKY